MFCIFMGIDKPGIIFRFHGASLLFTGYGSSYLFLPGFIADLIRSRNASVMYTNFYCRENEEWLTPCKKKMG